MTIKNINITDADFGEMTFTSSKIGDVGGLFGYAYGTVAIENVTNGRTLAYSGNKNFGGIIGSVDGSIKNSSVTITNVKNSADLSYTGTGNGYIGGLVGYLGVDATVTDSSNSGKISVTSANALSPAHIQLVRPQSTSTTYTTPAKSNIRA